jgi:hypothetical protein
LIGEVPEIIVANILKNKNFVITLIYKLLILNTMDPNHLYPRTHNAIIKSTIISLFLIISISTDAQPANFSGKWEFDKNLSDKEDRGDASFAGTIVMEITQVPATITFVNTYYMTGREPHVMKPYSYSADGSVTEDKSGTGPARKFIKWSDDGKNFTASTIMTDSIDGVAQEFLTANTYKLSDEGQTLIVEEFHKSILNGEKTIKKVYKKK